jgi:general secretion pathway protein F/type IV pilus assembly protein PilC
MPLYDYQAFSQQGKKQTGVIEANNEKEAKDKLREKGMMVSKVSAKTRVSSRQNLAGDNLLAFTLQLSQLVNAGVPLYESLVALEDQSQGESYHRILLSLCEQIKAGSSLSDAMKQYPESFDRLYCSMVGAGEAAGALGLILERLTQFLSRQMRLKKEITTALTYPLILSCFCMLIIGVLLGFVVPSIEGIFADRQLNKFTALVLGVSHIFRYYWWAYIPALVGFVGFSFYKLRSREGKLWLERVSLKIPLIRNLVIQTSIARFSRTMATLQQGGLTMIDSLRLSTDVMKNITLEEEMKSAETKIIEGSSLSAQLKRSKYIPSIVSRMLAVGEDTGNATIMFNKIADMYEDNLEKTLARVMTLAQPVILIIMGGIIGLVMVAILLPLSEVASLGSP